MLGYRAFSISVCKLGFIVELGLKKDSKVWLFLNFKVNLYIDKYYHAVHNLLPDH